MILDEIQQAPPLLPFIKARIDEDRRPARFVLSGSQSFAVMKGVSELRSHPEVDRTLWLSSYAQTYLERDVRDLVQVGDLGTFNRFIGSLAARSGNPLNMSDLGRDLGVSTPTVRRWVSVLEASHIVHLLRPYHRNFGKRLSKHPKPYLLDPGLLTFLLGLHSEEPLRRGPSYGAATETAVLGEWLKAFANRGEPPSVYFWRSTGGLEVDLVIERNQRLYAIEVKSTATPVPGHAESLRRFLKLAGPTARGVLACDIDEPRPLGGGVRAVPWHLAWCRGVDP